MFNKPVRLSLAATFTIVSAAQAATNFVWTAGAATAGTGAFTTANNWLRLDNGNKAAPGSAGNAIFTDAVFDNVSSYTITLNATPTTTVTIPTTLTVGSLSFGDSVAAKGIFTLSSDLTIGATGTTITLTDAAGLSRLAGGTDNLTNTTKPGTTYTGTQGKQTINSNLVVDSALTAQTWSIKGDSGSLTINGTIATSAAQTVTKSGGVRLELTNDNSSTFLGNYVAQGGDTLISNNNALGAGNTLVQVSGSGAGVVANSAVLTNSGITFAHDINVNANPNGVTTTLGGVSGQTSSVWTGAINLGQTTSFTGGSAGVTTFAGKISGVASATVNKSGNGKVILQAANDYAGATTVSAGTLEIDGQHTGGGAYSVASGATLTGTGTIATGSAASGLTIQSGGILAPAANGGTFSVTGDATVNGTLQINLDSLTASAINVSGALILGDGATLQLTGGTGLTAAAYPLLSYSSLTANWAAISIPNLPSGYQLVSDYAGNEIALIQATPEPASLAGIAIASVATLARRRRSV